MARTEHTADAALPLCRYAAMLLCRYAAIPLRRYAVSPFTATVGAFGKAPIFRERDDRRVKWCVPL